RYGEREALQDHGVVRVGIAAPLDPDAYLGVESFLGARCGRRARSGGAPFGSDPEQATRHLGSRGRTAEQRGPSRQRLDAHAAGDERVEVGDDLEALAGLRVEGRDPAEQFLHVYSDARYALIVVTPYALRTAV